MLKRAVAIAALLATALALTLAIPYAPWRTGRLPLEPLAPLPAQDVPQPAGRLWIDTDAACGHGSRTDPDDCLALLLLVDQAGHRIAGISTVFGNAALEVTDATTRLLLEKFGEKGRIPVHRGAAAPLEDLEGRALPPAVAALREALAEGPLTLVALGPLTNVALALQGRTQLAANVERLVAVMGRRPGHLFHPAEGAAGAMLLGHGPIFRDFNFEQDAQAAAAVLALGTPVTLVPYDAARRTEIDDAALDRLAARGSAHAWVAARARGWLAYWQEEIGRDGFYPFDLLAAQYAVSPRTLQCARVLTGIGEDPLASFSWSSALLVAQRPEELAGVSPTRPAIYCLGLRP